MKPKIYTISSPLLLPLYDLQDSVVVVIDVFRATSTIAVALFNGCKYIVPVSDINQCIELGMTLNAITAGERDGKKLDGLTCGNSPSQFSRDYIQNKILVLTTTNGTKLINQALNYRPAQIICGSFVNLEQVVKFLTLNQKTTYLCCAGWKNRFNLEDFLLAGAMANELKNTFEIFCDSTLNALEIYNLHAQNLNEFIKNTTHWHRLTSYGCSEQDLLDCVYLNSAPIVPFYENEKLIPKYF
ncbi:MAG: 2-phosphosulfolactate phosphatase [Alphaproteobacteria bacterium]|nr:2-phosphosulfolactate phosphatase [Alphaproteobacteria bacterium]